ncbi:hypothetical protein D3C78_1263360 [compost metagenome]
MASDRSTDGSEGFGDAYHQLRLRALRLRQFILQARTATRKGRALELTAVEQGPGVAQRDFTGSPFQQRRGAHAGGQRGLVAEIGQHVDAKQRISLAVELQ